MIRKLIFVLSLTIGLLLIASELEINAQGARSRLQKEDGAPKVGEMAPAIQLNYLFPPQQNLTELDLHNAIGKKPIILIFGSYT